MSFLVGFGIDDAVPQFVAEEGAVGAFVCLEEVGTVQNGAALLGELEAFEHLLLWQQDAVDDLGALFNDQPSVRTDSKIIHRKGFFYRQTQFHGTAHPKE